MIRFSATGEKAQEVVLRAYDLLSEEQSLRTTTSDIAIEGEEGLLRLNGRVRTNTMRDLAQRLALAAANGWQLENNLISDEELALDLATKLGEDPSLEDADVRCEVFLGTAYLKGAVRRNDQRDAAVEAATGIAGISKVVDHLAVGR